jgi:NADH:ubiquinone oxidoreductase subunit 6 (subunit J)
MLSAAAFWIFGLLAVASGFGVFRVNSMARATFLLAVSFIAVGADLLVLDLDYLGVVAILMMIMEMAVMAVFMIAYMMNPAGLMPMAMFHNKKASLAISLGTFVLFGIGIFLVPWPPRHGRPPDDTTLALGLAIMGQKGLVMVSVGALLFATMISVVVLAAPRGRYDRFGDRLERKHPEDPIKGGIGR